jgi:acyl-coenzyme A synthetase/AMP-(fatty) acid ligase
MTSVEMPERVSALVAGYGRLRRESARFAAHAYPRAVHVVAELPDTPNGKIQRFRLRQRRRAEVGGA